MLRTLLALLISLAPALAADRSSEDVLAAMFRGRSRPADFEDRFLAQVPHARVQDIVRALTAQYGALQRVESTPDGRFRVVLARGTVPVSLVLGDDGRVAGLWVHAATPTGLDPAGAVAALEADAALVGLLVQVDGVELAARAPDVPQAVGSAFKLAVLAGLADEVAAGRRRWDDVVRLEAADLSLPSGRLHHWPVGSPLTLHTLAALMMSESDNTATDALLRVVRPAAEAHAPHSTPLLPTRAAFVLKGPGGDDLLARWRAGDAEARRTVLVDAAARPLPSPAAFATPRATDVEWFFTARELCGLLDRVADLGLAGIEPGPVERAGWSSVAFKGGSEAGVLDLSWRAVAPDGRVVCVTAAWRSETTLDEDARVAAFGALLSTLKPPAP